MYSNGGGSALGGGPMTSRMQPAHSTFSPQEKHQRTISGSGAHGTIGGVNSAAKFIQR